MLGNVMKSCRSVFFLTLCLISLIIWWAPITITLLLAWKDDQYTHILIIVPISAALIFLERRKLESFPISRNDIVASIGMFLAALIFFFLAKRAINAADIQLSFFMAGLVLWLLASFIVCFGLESFWHFIFPLCFLFWIVPWPGALLDFVITALQHYSASL